MKTPYQILGSLFLCFAVNQAMANSALRETANGPDTALTVLNAQAAILSYDGAALPGANIGISTRIGNRAPLYLGAEIGLFVATGTPSYATLPLMGSLYYQFEPSAVVHPLLGVMAGPVISTGNAYSTVRFGTFFRPGINVELGEKAVLNVETRFGVIGSTFVFLPEVGVILPL